MKLIKRFGMLFSMLFLAVACSSGGDEAPEPVALATPMPSVEVQGAIVTITWAPVEHAASYTYEFFKNGSLSESKSVQIPSFSYKMEGETNYGFRVKATADDSGLYLDSSWSGTIQNQLGKLASTTAQVVEGTLTTTTVSIKWAKITDAVKYHYQLLEGSNVVKESDVTTPEVDFAELKPSTTYQFKVKGISDGSKLDSNYSSVLSFTTKSPLSNNPLGLPEHEMDGVIRAFPGAEGGGMYTTGGRGGKVIHVTNLNDSGTGSLRAAINQSGKRIIVFDVAGTIHLQSRLNINQGDVTIAGQTAPGDGICLADNSVYVGANNVIIRFLRFRMGDVKKVEDDAIWGRDQQNIIIDHCSMSWSTDECASFYANKNFTLQWCLLGESLKNSVHGKGSHGYGGIWGGKNASFHHNLLAHHSSRNPRFSHPQVGNAANHKNVDYRNNVVYNWGDNSTYGGEGASFNMVGNYYKPGPASKQRKYFIDANGYYSSGSTQYKYPRLYMQGNYHAGSYATALNSDNWQGVYWHDQDDATKHAAGDAAGAKLSAPLAIKKDDATACYTSTHTADKAFARVLECAGASLRRDAVDTRLIDDARNGKATYTSGGNGSTGGMIDTQSAVGGWPTLSATNMEIIRATTDTDKDEIPDYYEEQLGLDKNKADADVKTLDPQGLYSNFEIYLHFLVKDIVAAQTADATYKILN